MQEVCQRDIAVRRENNLVEFTPDNQTDEGNVNVQRRVQPIDDIGDVLAVLLYLLHALAQFLVLPVINDEDQFHVSGLLVGVVRSTHQLLAGSLSSEQSIIDRVMMLVVVGSVEPARFISSPDEIGVLVQQVVFEPVVIFDIVHIMSIEDHASNSILAGGDRRPGARQSPRRSLVMAQINIVRWLVDHVLAVLLVPLEVALGDEIAIEPQIEHELTTIQIIVDGDVMRVTSILFSRGRNLSLLSPMVNPGLD